ncbi:MAG: hypothetical protein KDB07_07330 [Planctomycetes bacterium]|nr:hypothetical protein [Planctomycetota bacterium]
MKRIFQLGCALGLSAAMLACAGKPKQQVLYPPPFPDKEAPDLWKGESISTPIVIDGTLEAAWLAAPVKTVWLRHAADGTRAFPVFLRALFDGDHVYLSAQWPDLSDDSMPDRFVWNEGQLAYEPSSKAEDMFAFSFQLKGELQTTMLTTKGYEADVWHWKAGRGNGAGYADDKRTIVSNTRISGGHAFDLYDGQQCWIARPADAGSPAYSKRTPPLQFSGQKFEASYEEVKPSGSRGDVQAKGVHHDGKHWTLEFKRRLNTGTDDDVIFRDRRDTPVTVAVWNNSKDLDHVVSQVLHLRLLAPLDGSE